MSGSGGAWELAASRVRDELVMAYSLRQLSALFGPGSYTGQSASRK